MKLSSGSIKELRLAKSIGVPEDANRGENVRVLVCEDE